MNRSFTRRPLWTARPRQRRGVVYNKKKAEGEALAGALPAA
jgi:hypothetical protein